MEGMEGKKPEGGFDEFVQKVLAIPPLANYLINGAVDEMYAVSNGFGQGQMISMELSAPPVSPSHVAMLYKASAERAERHGFAVVNVIDANVPSPVQTPFLGEAPPSRISSMSASGNSLPKDSGFDEEVSPSQDGAAMEIDSSGAAESPDVRITEADLRHSSSTAVFLHRGVVRVGCMIGGEIYESDSLARLEGMLKGLGIEEMNVVCARFIGSARTGEKLELMLLDSGVCLVVYALFGLLTPKMIEIQVCMGLPWVKNSEGMFRVTRSKIKARMRMINMSECTKCRRLGLLLCDCEQSALVRGLLPLRKSSESASGLASAVDPADETDLQASFAALVGEREALPRCARDPDNGLQNSLIRSSGCVLEGMLQQPPKGQSWFRSQMLSATGRLLSEFYQLMECSSVVVDQAGLQLFHALFGTGGPFAQTVLSPLSESRLLQNSEQEVENASFVLASSAREWQQKNPLALPSANHRAVNSSAVKLESALEKFVLQDRNSSSETDSERASPRGEPSAGEHACTECGKVFTSRYNLKRHEKSIHTSERPFSCSQCGMAFKVKDHLMQHIRVTHDAKARDSFECDMCGIRFITKSNLRRHVRETHENIRPFECTVCGKGFRSKFSLSRHLASNVHVAPAAGAAAV